jgi:hypothetical protein
MTTQAAFSPEEWTVVLQGPPTAGLIVITAAHGGTFRETFAMSKAYAEARAEHGESELLDEIVSAKPKTDHTRYHSAEELRDNGLGHLRDAMALRPPGSAMTTGVSCSPSPARSPRPTGSTGRA